MRKLYCISGLGADEKAFQYLDLSFAEPVFVTWISPLLNETLPAYGRRLKEAFITETDPCILGLSFGGMVAVEIAKELPKATIVIISSAKTKYEFPFYWRLFSWLPLYRIMPSRVLKRSTSIQQYFLGAKSALSSRYAKNAMAKADINFYKWAIGAIITWQNKSIPPNIIHIHGDNDKLMPMRFLKPDYVIEHGGHLLVIDQALEISALLKQIFNEENKTDELNLPL